VNLTGFNIGTTPFNYLGVPIFKEKPKARFLQPIADKVKAKLSAWKASLLTIAGRTQLVKSVVQSMLIYTISVYDWPISLLKDLEDAIRNFIWNGDIHKRKLVTVSWKKLCKPTAQGGLGLRSLITINQAANLKLCWDMLHSNDDWSKLLMSRVIRNGKIISHHIFSSIWSSIKNEWFILKDNTNWLLGDGNSIKFWQDAWCGVPFTTFTNSNNFDENELVSSFIQDNRWSFPPHFSVDFPEVWSIVHKETILLAPQQDELIWKETSNGQLTLKDAYNFKANSFPEVQWAKVVWSPNIPPSRSLLVWRIMHDKVPVDDKLRERGVSFPSMCSLCSQHEESTFHLFFTCSFASHLWRWFAVVLHINISFPTIDDLWKVCDRGWSPQCKLAIQASIIGILNAIWSSRNNARFNSKIIHWRNSISQIISSASLSANMSKLAANSSISEFTILKALNVSINPPESLEIKEVIWHPPIQNWIKCNCDGAAISNPNKAACGGIFRNKDAQFLGCFDEGLGSGNSLFAEMSGAMRAIEFAKEKNWRNVWLETDSMSVVLAFKSQSFVPWQLRNRWRNCLLITSQMNILVSHIYTEGNACVDALANIGLTLDNYVYYYSIPLQVRSDYVKNRLGWPNFRFNHS